MPTDYSQFKTPTFTVQISDAQSGKFLTLPHHIHRLIEKVEIHETLEPGEYTAITITFVEGSREPFPVDAQAAANSLYESDAYAQGTDKDITGSITNRVGALTDLRFNKGGLTWLTGSEMKAGKVDSSPKKTINGKIIRRIHKNEHSKPTFLFQEGNMVKVTWGYADPHTKKRSIVARIAVTSVDFPDNGPITTTISCLPTRAFTDIAAREKGIKFGTVDKTSKGNTIVNFTDATPDSLLRKIAEDNGFPAIISKNLLGPSLDNGKAKMWLGGESFNQFMDRLAEQHGCRWDLITDPKTHKDTLIFIKNSDFESVLVIKDRSLTAYKSPGTLLRSLNIKADFTAIVGAASKNVDNKGSEMAGTVDVNEFDPVYQNKDSKNFAKPVQGNPALNGLNMPVVTSLTDPTGDGSARGHVEIHPSSSQDKHDGLAKSYVSLRDRMINLDFNMIGYPFITPGMVEFSNIGVRYSGKYRVLTVTHSMDNTGYVTTGTATSFSLPVGGVNANPPKEKDPEDKSIDVAMFGPRDNTNVPNNPIQDYHKLKLSQ